MKLQGKLGLSEIISALLLTMIALSIFSILYIFLSNYFTERKSILHSIYSSNIERLLERVTIAYAFYNDSGLYLCIYNYGYVDAKIVLLFINDTLVDNSLITPLELPVDELTIVHVDVSLNQGVYYIKIVSERGNSYETFVKV